MHHGLMSARLDVCAVGVYLRQVRGAVADEVDEHVSIASKMGKARFTQFVIEPSLWPLREAWFQMTQLLFSWHVEFSSLKISADQ